MERAEYRRMAALEDRMWWYRALRASLCQRLEGLGLGQGARLLDAGCGTGGLLRHLGGKFPGFRLQGVEYDPEAAAVASAKAGWPVAVGSVNALPFEAETFDALVSADVLCHAGVEEAVALAEFARCLKPGGRLLLSLPAYDWMRSAHDVHVHNARRYTAARLRQALQRAGFRVTRAGYWNSLLFPVMALHRLTAGQAKAESDVQEFPPWLDRLFFAITVVERGLSRLGLDLPFGGSVWAVAIKP